MTADLLLAGTAGMLGAVNPCGFALLPAYLSVLVAGDPGSPGRAVRRALLCSAALALGYAAVFGVFGLVLTPVAGWLTPRLPWLTVVLGLTLAALGGWLLAGRSLPATRMRAPELTGSVWSTVLFGAAYAIASLGCAVGPFLALVVSSLRAGSVAAGVGLFLAYASGMALVVAVTAVAVALARASLIARTRRLLGLVPRLGGAILLVSGLYVGYYGWYELRLARNPRGAGADPVVNAAAQLQRWLAELVSTAGAVTLGVVLAVLVVAPVVVRRPAGRSRPRRPAARSASGSRAAGRPGSGCPGSTAERERRADGSARGPGRTDEPARRTHHRASGLPADG
jgi:cytochrome c-type biogenesis protein